MNEIDNGICRTASVVNAQYEMDELKTRIIK